MVTGVIGGTLRFIADKFFPNFEKDAKGQIIASGVLGGEAIVGGASLFDLVVGDLMHE